MDAFNDREDEIGNPFWTPRSLQDALDEKTELEEALDKALDEDLKRMNDAGYPTCKAETLLKAIRVIRRTPISEIIAKSENTLAQMGKREFLKMNGIDLTDVEKKLKRKYGEADFENKAYLFKYWLKSLVYFLQENHQEELPNAIKKLQDLLADDN